MGFFARDTFMLVAATAYGGLAGNSYFSHPRHSVLIQPEDTNRLWGAQV